DQYPWDAKQRCDLLRGCCKGSAVKADPGEPLPRLLTTAEAASYLRFRSTSGIRTAVYRGELHPVGAGPKCCHMFTIAELDRFVSARGARYAHRHLAAHGDRRDPPREEQRNCDKVSGRVPPGRDDVLDPREGDGPSHGQQEGGNEAPR